MKIPVVFPALAALLLLAASPVPADEVKRLSEPVAAGEGYEVFGSPVGDVGDPIRLGEIIAAGEKYSGQDVHTTAKVGRVCQNRGCWMTAYDGEATARVTFVDYSFFVPTDTGGKDVGIVGTFTRKVTPEAEARQKAEEAGENPDEISGDRVEYAIVATSVVIPTS
jgi:hypothetical protein